MSHSTTTRLDTRIKKAAESVAIANGHSIASVINWAVLYGLPIVEADIKAPGILFQLETVIALAQTYVDQIDGDENEAIVEMYRKALQSSKVLAQFMTGAGGAIATTEPE